MTQDATTEVEITRVFNAPRALVWKAWTDPEMYRQWYGPEGFTVPICEIDLRVGGKVLFGMRSPDGQMMYTGGEYAEIDPPRRFVATGYSTDEHGNKISPAEYGMPDWPDETRITVTLEEADGRTTMTMTHGPLPAGPMADGANAGWNQSFGKLEALLSA
jgi:uncharacterized protein YndB with AHSA1/START domain